MHDKSSAPFPFAIVGAPGLERVPPKQEPLFSIGSCLGRVKSPAVEYIVFRSNPWTCDVPAHSISCLVALTKLREDEIPPLSYLEQIGALVCIVKSRRPERLSRLPMGEIFRTTERRATASARRARIEPGCYQHPVLAGLFIPKDEWVAPVVSLIDSCWRIECVFISFLPMDKIIADSVQHALLRLVGDIRRVIAGIKSVITARLVLDNRSGRYGKVLVLTSAAW